MKKYYQTKKDFIHRKIAGNEVLISVGDNVAHFNGYIEMNETAAYLWEFFAESKSLTDAAESLSRRFQIDVESARGDVKEFIDMLLSHEMIEVKG